VRWLNPASRAAFACMVAAVFCASGAAAQVHAGSTPVAVSAAHTPQPAAINAARGNQTAGARVGLSQRPPQSGGSHPGALHSGVPHPHRRPFPVGGAVYALPYPFYLTDPGADGSDVDAAGQQPDNGNYGPGPTIFDNNGSNNTATAYESDGPAQPRAAYATGYQNMHGAAPQAESMPPSAADRAPDSAPVDNQPQTVLVFKDGHLQEVQNYAIVGDMLYDVSAGHHSKIALADLDLNATTKENDDRGIDFQLPNRLTTN